jgi:hypothetical protein
LVRQAEVVKTLAAQAEVAHDDESDDEEEEARTDAEREKEAAEKKKAEEKAKAEAEAAEAEGPPLSAHAKRRVENARWLRKVKRPRSPWARLEARSDLPRPCPDLAPISPRSRAS